MPKDLLAEQPKDLLATAQPEKSALSRFLSGVGGNVLKAQGALVPRFLDPQDQFKTESDKGLNDATGAAGTAGKIVGDVIKYSMVPAGVLKNTIGSAGVGALTAGGGLENRLNEGALSGAGGLVGSVAGKAIPYVYQAGKAIAQPFYNEGRKDIVSNFLKNIIGNTSNRPNRLNEVIQSLDNAHPLVPGSMPTAAEIASNGGLSAAQRWAAQANSSEYAYRNTANANARSAAIQSIAKDKSAIDAALEHRRVNTEPLYEAAKNKTVPIDNELLSLLHRPSVGKALSKAEEIAAESGAPISQQMKQSILTGQQQGFISGEALHHLKIGLDSLLKDPKNPLQGEEKRALQGTIKKFETWRENNIPEYMLAQNKYKELSQSINQMQIAQELYNSAKPALTDFGDNLTRETGNTYAQALRESARVVKKSTGKDYLTLENTMNPEQLRLLGSVANDFNRKIGADELGRGIGSNTFQNIAMQNMAEKSGILPTLITKGITRVPVVGGILAGGERALLNGPETEMKTLLADTLLDPKKTAELLKRTQNISNVEKLLSNKAAQKLPSSVITAILLNRKQDNEK
jgi:hypothetical protein